MKKKILKILGAAIGLCLVFTLILYTMQEKFIFLPTKLSEEYAFQFSKPFSEFNLTTQDGAILNALHFTTENPKGVILYYHGNAGDLSRWGEVASYFTQFEYDVIVMDYRTFGKSTGTLSENALYKDAQLFYEYTKERYPEDKINVYGRSLGTTFATYVASQNNPKQLLLETPFNNLTSVVRKRFFYLPVNYLLNYKFPSDTYISSVQCSVIILHGTNDSTVSYELGKKLSKKLPKEQMKFITIEGGKHKNLIEFETYRKGIQKALK